jgi:hypothetical protein
MGHVSNAPCVRVSFKGKVPSELDLGTGMLHYQVQTPGDALSIRVSWVHGAEVIRISRTEKVGAWQQWDQ